MTLNCIKLGRAVTFIKYLASEVSVIFLPKTLIWKKIKLWIPNLLNLVELVVNELTKSISKKIYQYSLFYPFYHCCCKDFRKTLISVAFYLS